MFLVPSVWLVRWDWLVLAPSLLRRSFNVFPPFSLIHLYFSIPTVRSSFVVICLFACSADLEGYQFENGPSLSHDDLPLATCAVLGCFGFDDETVRLWLRRVKL